MKKRIVLLVLLCIPSQLCFSCSYPEVTPEYALKKANKVFIGQAIKAKVTKQLGWITTFRVLKTIKGEVKHQELVSNSDLICGHIKYVMGHKYIVFADENNLVSGISGHEKYYTRSEPHKVFESSKFIEYLRTQPGFDW